MEGERSEGEVKSLEKSAKSEIFEMSFVSNMNEQKTKCGCERARPNRLIKIKTLRLIQ